MTPVCLAVLLTSQITLTAPNTVTVTQQSYVECPTTLLNIKVTPRRMLSGSEAAAYCGVPVKRFHVLCNCRPIAMPHGQKLYDIKDLDVWLDSLKTNAPDSDFAIVGKLGNDTRAA